jgi:hypothetical protein
MQTNETWRYQMSIASTTSTDEKPEKYVLLVGTAAALSAAGIDMGMVVAVPCPPPSPGDSPKLMIGRMRTDMESDDEVQAQLLHLKVALQALSRTTEEELRARWLQALKSDGA